ncbi:phage integrase SAM-like domain-containing protein [Clostridium baratii]|uniref:transposase-like zinc-binding domain-containing protein n=1 Tax=Clostridium baratii TaxID=1561 RepID=UPI0028FEEDA4|nr:phage integrase SAM-like domain-containing protein [Clostridium baratii]MDU1054456.1 phage integrase SAM-like domain-containing protein [Clostridium baratii]
MIKFNECPFCSSSKFIKYGKYNKIQRYKCKNQSCNKTFSDCTNTVWYNSKKSTDHWYKYCKLMFSGKTIRECASKLNISINTSFQWRHKILNKLPICNKTIYLDNYIGFKNIYLYENFKGKKNLYLLNQNRKKVFISVCVNENKTSFAQIISKDILNQKKSYRLIKGKLNFKSQVIGFLDRYAIAISKKLNKNLMKLKRYSKSKEIELRNLTNLFCMKLRTWLSFFKGVATKYLDSYLYWFVHIFENSFSNKIISSKILSAIFCS